MSRSAEYREKAVNMMRSAMAATGADRQTYIGLAAAWNALARDADAVDGPEQSMPDEPKTPGAGA